MSSRSAHTGARRPSLDGFFAETGRFRVGTRVRVVRGARKGRTGTVVSAPRYDIWFNGKPQGRVDVDYGDSGNVPPFRTWLHCLEPLPVVDQLAGLLNDQG